MKASRHPDTPLRSTIAESMASRATFLLSHLGSRPHPYEADPNPFLAAALSSLMDQDTLRDILDTTTAFDEIDLEPYDSATISHLALEYLSSMSDPNKLSHPMPVFDMTFYEEAWSILSRILTDDRSIVHLRLLLASPGITAARAQVAKALFSYCEDLFKAINIYHTGAHEHTSTYTAGRAPPLRSEQGNNVIQNPRLESSINALVSKVSTAIIPRSYKGMIGTSSIHKVRYVVHFMIMHSGQVFQNIQEAVCPATPRRLALANLPSTPTTPSTRAPFPALATPTRANTPRIITEVIQTDSDTDSDGYQHAYGCKCEDCSLPINRYRSSTVDLGVVGTMSSPPSEYSMYAIQDREVAQAESPAGSSAASRRPSAPPLSPHPPETPRPFGNERSPIDSPVTPTCSSRLNAKIYVPKYTPTTPKSASRVGTPGSRKSLRLMDSVRQLLRSPTVPQKTSTVEPIAVEPVAPELYNLSKKQLIEMVQQMTMRVQDLEAENQRIETDRSLTETMSRSTVTEYERVVQELEDLKHKTGRERDTLRRTQKKLVADRDGLTKRIRYLEQVAAGADAYSVYTEDDFMRPVDENTAPLDDSMEKEAEAKKGYRRSVDVSSYSRALQDKDKDANRITPSRKGASFIKGILRR
eukprot:TRINITY_DN6463_c0_g1_i2.p1 TRINITY_DN6463_c0_g1~~TRINITY_DN6463_c0_g1_i2.p1  ORF type:complete len:641 (+),score=145.77 TRINITY_DN6463_c0_g1_i2:174-2096(+)